MISACLLLYNDHDILRAALHSVGSFADEIVVVDGAYEWLAPILGPAGLPTDRSTDECLDVLNGSGLAHKIRYFSGTWKNELEKRAFAYDRCTRDLVHLVDADEIHQLDEVELRRFVQSAHAVGALEAPLLATDRLASRRKGDPHLGLPPKPVLFKRARVSAPEHLAYLWLVLRKSEEAELSPKNAELMHAAPLGRMLHLSNLRTLETGLHRCRFYVFNWIREHGTVPWLPEVDLGADAELQRVYQYVSPPDLDQFLRGNAVSLGLVDDPAVEYFDVAIDPTWGPTVRAAYESFSRSVSAPLRRGSFFMLNGSTFIVDCSERLAPGQRLALTFDQPIATALVERISVFPGGLVRTRAFHGPVGATELHCELPAPPVPERPFRDLVSISAWMSRSRPPALHVGVALPG
ncbi:MAG TPA: hypothetical protein VHE30_29050 [Polyangiaceae bacterium]|nr:hypothetical protein [Polyangiaceae bacterium]